MKIFKTIIFKIFIFSIAFPLQGMILSKQTGNRLKSIRQRFQTNKLNQSKINDVEKLSIKPFIEPVDVPQQQSWGSWVNSLLYKPKLYVSKQLNDFSKNRIKNKIDKITQEVKNRADTAPDSLLWFLRDNDYRETNLLLDKLVFFTKTRSDNGIGALNEVLFSLKISNLSEKTKRSVVEKLIVWTKANLMQLLRQDVSTSGEGFSMISRDNSKQAESFLLELVDFDENQELAPIIIENLASICKTYSGIELIKHLIWISKDTVLDNVQVKNLWMAIFATIKNQYQKFATILNKTYDGKYILLALDKDIAKEDNTYRTRE